jgi:hypothetical protein
MPSKATATQPVNEDAVRTRAYLMWEADGRPFGRDEHYWGLALAEATQPAKPKRSAASARPAEKKSKAASKPAGKSKAAGAKASKK